MCNLLIVAESAVRRCHIPYNEFILLKYKLLNCIIYSILNKVVKEIFKK
ncbi:hypothetical protein LMANV2_60036 [Leptospira interrogans serovar Manilae]|uniref:Uncharacterized protein n=1 Tax=Leptospira interrogans serovar Manilae TaxID=214675 RepID=A0AAQ1P274_LEPIR|nr:hypothetical protein LMANV2_60036 [Leptospira interrogans serovar Manilae]